MKREFHETMPRGPQSGLLFRMVAAAARFQLRTLLRNTRHKKMVLTLFVFGAATSSLGIITLAAYLVSLPLLFPPLGPSAFILFHTPMSDRASPRSVLLGHVLSLFAGVVILKGVRFIAHHPEINAVQAFGGIEMVPVALTLGASAAVMLLFDCVHPPAAASGLIAAMGYVSEPIQIFGFVSAVVLLVVNAVFFNRVLGGLPYPLWRLDVKLMRSFPALAGLCSTGTGYWHELADAMIHETRRF